MIFLTRVRTVKSIDAKYRGADKREWDKALLMAQRDILHGDYDKINFDTTYWKSAKKQLKKESFGKCAYCEANAQIVAHGDVEHFRPKSLYWWLAYTYDNYLYSCQICNQIYKKDFFPAIGIPFPNPVLNRDSSDKYIHAISMSISPDPIDINTNYTLDQYIAHHLSEYALLINPYFEDPSEYIAYKADDTKQEVAIVPKKPIYADVIDAMEKYFGINRIELKNARFEVYRNFRVYKLFAKTSKDIPLVKEAELQIEFMTTDKYVFAGMNRYFDAVL